MSSIFTGVLIGFVGGQPRSSCLQSGTQVCDFSIAHNYGKERQNTMWIKVYTYGKLAQTCAQYLQAKQQVAVTGEITMEEWEDKRDGSKRSQIRLNATSVQFVGRVEGQGQAGGYGNAGGGYGQSQYGQPQQQAYGQPQQYAQPQSQQAVPPVQQQQVAQAPVQPPPPPFVMPNDTAVSSEEPLPF